jgi:hypothetical protein
VTRGEYCGLLESESEGRPGNLDIVIRLWLSIQLLEGFGSVAMDSIC